MGKIMNRRIIDMIVRIMIFIAVICGVAACQTTKGSFCTLSSPVRLSSKAVTALTDAEVKDILARNRVGEKLCGWKP